MGKVKKNGGKSREVRKGRICMRNEKKDKRKR